MVRFRFTYRIPGRSVFYFGFSSPCRIGRASRFPLKKSKAPAAPRSAARRPRHACPTLSCVYFHVCPTRSFLFFAKASFDIRYCFLFSLLSVTRSSLIYLAILSNGFNSGFGVSSLYLHLYYYINRDLHICFNLSYITLQNFYP